MLANHTPTQIRIGFNAAPMASARTIAQRILAGRYGFRKGLKQPIKQARKPPKKRAKDASETPDDPQELQQTEAKRMEVLRRLAGREEA